MLIVNNNNVIYLGTNTTTLLIKYALEYVRPDKC